MSGASRKRERARRKRSAAPTCCAMSTSPKESSNAPGAEEHATVSVPRFEEMVNRLASLLNEYTGEVRAP